MSDYFVRASCMFFAAAILAALLKLGAGAFGVPTAAKPLAVRNAAPEPATQSTLSSDAKPMSKADYYGISLLTDVDMKESRRSVAGTEPSASGSESTAADEEWGEPPVFYRPRGRVSGEAGQSSNGYERARGGPLCGTLGDFPKNSRAVFPLPRTYFDSYEDTWGAPRVQGGHEGTDLMSPRGTPEFAITDGTIVPVSGANGRGWNTLGGYTVMLQAAYDIGPVRKGDLFYYAHLDRESALPIGARVRAGQQIGVAGDTGQGPEITRGLFPSHLHLGWYDASGARTNLESGAMNPYPLLQWLKRHGGAVSGGTDTAYCEAPQSPNPSPANGGDWPHDGSPGQTPDLDTGSGRNPSPSPIVEQRERPGTGTGNGGNKGADEKTENTSTENTSNNSSGGAAPRADGPGNGAGVQNSGAERMDTPENEGTVSAGVEECLRNRVRDVIPKTFRDTLDDNGFSAIFPGVLVLCGEDERGEIDKPASRISPSSQERNDPRDFEDTSGGEQENRAERQKGEDPDGSKTDVSAGSGESGLVSEDDVEGETTEAEPRASSE